MIGGGVIGSYYDGLFVAGVATGRCGPYGGLQFGQAYFGDMPVLDLQLATAIIISETRTKISRVNGFDSSVVTWTADRDFSSYQFRIVANPSDPYSVGVQIEHDQSPSSGGRAGLSYTSTLTDAEVEAVSSGEGDKLVKLFVQTPLGWSS